MSEIKQEAGYQAHGTKLEVSLDGKEYTLISNLVTVTPPAVTADEIETTDHSGNGWKKFIPGLKDGGSMPFKVNVSDVANVERLFQLSESGQNVKWRITVPTAPLFVVELEGFVKTFNLDELVSGSAVTATGEIRNVGQPKFGFKK